MTKQAGIALWAMVTSSLIAQTSPDSVTISVRRYAGPSPTVFWTGQFNDWQTTAWPMTYQGDHWLITKRFKIHDASDPQRNLGDSVYQYKFTTGPAGSTSWSTDPLNPEQNPLDNNNSILRLSQLFWFQYYQFENGTDITKIAMTLGHADADSITAVKLTTAETADGPFTITDITANLNRTTRVVNYLLPVPIPRSSLVRLAAFNQSGDSVVYAKGGYVVQTMEMPAAAKHGVTLPAQGPGDSTTFRLRVSGKEFVLLHIAPVGDSPASVPGVVMRKHTGASPDWWINLSLAPGTYEYLYEIENGKLLTDPWGREVGQYGTRFTVGPEGLTADDYVWTSNSYVRPAPEKLVIYELHIGEFAGGHLGKTDPNNSGTFLELASMMGHFDSLGITAIEVMPPNDFGSVGRSGHSWGYDLNTYFALEPGYGTPRDFKALVDSAHAHGIAIIVDVVFNHLNETSALWQMQPDDIQSPYFKANNDLRYNEDNLFFFKDLDHWTNETQELVLSSLKMWLDEYRVDGFRYDFTQGIGWNINEPTKGILGWANAIHQQYGGQVYQIVEHLPESPALVNRSGITGGWHDSFRDEIFKELIFKNVSLYTIQNLVLKLGAYGGNDTPSTPSTYGSRSEPVNATVTHDEQSLIYEMNVYQGTTLEEAIHRDKLYGTLMFTSLGMPMLWEGMEFGESRGFTEQTKLGYRPVDATLKSTQRGMDHFRHYQSLIHHRTKNPALYRGTMVDLALVMDGVRRVLVWGFLDSLSGSSVIVAANLASADAEIENVPWIGNGTWYDLFDQGTTEVSGLVVPQLSIPGHTARVFANRSNKDLDILTSANDDAQPLPSDYSLSQNYPNPFNPETRISFSTKDRGNVRISVYDLLGREVVTLVNGEREAGRYTATWNASGLPSGVYFCRMTSGVFTQTIRLVLNR